MTDCDNLLLWFAIHELNNPFIRVAVSVDKKAHLANSGTGELLGRYLLARHGLIWRGHTIIILSANMLDTVR